MLRKVIGGVVAGETEGPRKFLAAGKSRFFLLESFGLKMQNFRPKTPVLEKVKDKIQILSTCRKFVGNSQCLSELVQLSDSPTFLKVTHAATAGSCEIYLCDR